MTPLAQMLLNDYCAPKSKRKLADPHGMLPTLSSAKCFDVTALHEAMRLLDGTQPEDFLASDRVFLPAPVTFLELKINVAADDNFKRKGILLVQEGQRIDVWFCLSDMGLRPVGKVDFSSNRIGIWEVLDGPKDTCVVDQLIGFVTALLFLINTPHVCGQVTHLPHAGLQKKLAAKAGRTGRFPLHAWTELTVWCDANDRCNQSSDGEIEARLSGQRCLHFVRSFLRWRRGQLERVKAHYRGDASLGIKRSRYIAKPVSREVLP